MTIDSISEMVIQSSGLSRPTLNRQGAFFVLGAGLGPNPPAEAGVAARLA